MANVVRERIEAALDGMSDQDLRKVLGAVNGVRASNTATFGELLEEFGGSIPADELDRMERAIEEDCERIDVD